ncbi:MAG: phosphatidylserine/phosphatidylglycerophosphate/cardiolipin synthase family protein [Alphaproteobacteria bacterium]|nr:phosphatidylserine/phosphatidylglycerophosphate/cardiolipin synthase family protein [Alphaproteobacteria bacterium]
MTGETAVFEVAGHSVRLLPDGPQAWPALVELVEGATESLRLFFYIFADDARGTELRDRLVAAAKRGVKVQLAVDGFGSGDTPAAFFDPLTDAGAGFCRFHPHWGRRFLLRNHQKMAIADGQRAIVGGFNVADPYFDPHRPDSWRDLGLEIAGPQAAHLARYYDRLFNWITQKRSRIWQLRRILPALTQGDGALRWIFGGPSRRISPYARQVRADFAHASRLEMIMGYFAPNLRFLRMIGRIAQRGEAKLITAGKTDVPLSRDAAWATYGSLLRRGVRIAEFQPRALHAKLIVADDAVYIGSGNFDMRSLYLNLEVMLRIEDAAFAAAMRELFAREWERSDTVDPRAYRELATPWNRLRWRFSYWFFVTADFALSRSLTSRG